jgi:hypothetical protein
MSKKKEDIERYRKVSPRIWNDKNFRLLSDDGKLVFLFILTHPSLTALGAMRHTLAGLAAEFEWNAKRFADAFAESADRSMLVFDRAASLVAAPNFIRHNQPESPNVIKGWKSARQLLPECESLNAHLEKIGSYLALRDGEAFTEAFRQAFPDVLVKGNAGPSAKDGVNQEQEQEQEQEQQQDSPNPQGAAAASLRSELKNAGVGEPSLSRCESIPGLTPVIVLLLSEQAAREKRRNPAGWLVSHLTGGGFAPPKRVPPRDVCRLIRAGRIGAVAGHPVDATKPPGFNDADPSSAFVQFTDVTGTARKVPAAKLTPEEITLKGAGVQS